MSWEGEGDGETSSSKSLLHLTSHVSWAPRARLWYPNPSHYLGEHLQLRAQEEWVHPWNMCTPYTGQITALGVRSLLNVCIQAFELKGLGLRVSSAIVCDSKRCPTHVALSFDGGIRPCHGVLGGLKSWLCFRTIQAKGRRSGWEPRNPSGVLKSLPFLLRHGPFCPTDPGLWFILKLLRGWG